MSHRRPEPHQTALENILRNALRLAADSVDPAADGLDLIRAKISARQPAPLPGWRTAVPVLLWSLLRWLESAGVWLRYALSVVVDRFRPDAARTARAGWLGWLGWLRPAAAMATGLFVVAAASWAITALPVITSPANDSSTFHNGGPSGGGGHPKSSMPGTNISSGSTGPDTPVSASSSPTCTSTPPASPSPSASPSGSASPTPSTSPSPSSSPSPSLSTTSGSGSPAPSGSSTPPAPTTTPAVQDAQAAQRIPASASGSLPGSSGSLPGSSSAGSVISPAPLTSQQPYSPC